MRSVGGLQEMQLIVHRSLQGHRIRCFLQRWYRRQYRDSECHWMVDSKLCSNPSTYRWSHFHFHLERLRFLRNLCHMERHRSRRSHRSKRWLPSMKSSNLQRCWHECQWFHRLHRHRLVLHEGVQDMGFLANNRRQHRRHHFHLQRESNLHLKRPQ